MSSWKIGVWSKVKMPIGYSVVFVWRHTLDPGSYEDEALRSGWSQVSQLPINLPGGLIRGLHIPRLCRTNTWLCSRCNVLVHHVIGSPAVTRLLRYVLEPLTRRKEESNLSERALFATNLHVPAEAIFEFVLYYLPFQSINPTTS